MAGLVDVWGKAKCYKSSGPSTSCCTWPWGGSTATATCSQGAVVYCAFEGAHGYKKRVEALRRHYDIEDGTPCRSMSCRGRRT